MLDKTSKNILKYMKSHAENSSEKYYNFGDDLEEMAKDLSSDGATIRASIRFLEEHGYIKYRHVHTHTGNSMVTHFFLDHKGLHWKEFRKQEVIKYFEDKWIDFFALLVATAALIVSVLTWLQLPQG